MATLQNVGSLAKSNTNNTKVKFSVVLQSDAAKNLINSAIQDPQRRVNFTANILSVVANDTALQNCEWGTVLSGALVAEALKLPLSPALGQAYLVAYADRKNNRIVAQFILGYKGFLTLAIRSGNYKKINVFAIKEGELIKFDPVEEELKINLIEDEEKRESAPTIGYYAMFEYINGFKKAIYWSKKKMELHAKKYSTGYANDLAKGTKYTFWSKDFDGMAYKTMLRQLISKWGIMSVEMEKAYVADQAVIDENNNYTYIDNLPEDENGVVEEMPAIPETNVKKENAKGVVKEAVAEPVKEPIKEPLAGTGTVKVPQQATQTFASFDIEGKNL